MAVQTQIQVRRGTASSWTSTNPTLAAGEIGFESDTGKIKVGTGSATWNSLTYIGAANAIQYVYNASAGQTTFSGADANGATLSYTVGAEQVYVNGVLQVRGTDYTATNGTSVVLTTATIASDIVTVVAMGTFTVADTYTQAQANATFPLNTSAFFAGKNKIINGDFGIWQRGTSSTSAGYVTADRWYCDRSNTTTFAQDTALAPTGFQYVLKATAGATTDIYFVQVIETANCIRMAGQTVTLSAYVGSSASQNFTFQLDYSTSVDNGTAGSWTTITATSGGTQTTTSTLARANAIYSVPSTAKSLRVLFKVTSVTNTNWAAITGVQLEAGSVATAFQTATGTIQGELAACQRYYQRITNTGAGDFLGSAGNAYSTTKITGDYVAPVPMRVLPTSIDASNIRLWDGVTATAITAAAITGSQAGNVLQADFTVASGLTQYRYYQVIANTGISYLGFSAEL